MCVAVPFAGNAMSREYMTAGRALDAVAKGQTFKAYCSKVKIGTTDFLLASETLKYREVISTLLDKSAVSAKSLDVGSNGVLYVLVYELLFGRGKIRGGGGVKRRLMDVEESLRMVLANEMAKKGVTQASLMLSEHIRKADSTLRQYLRVNTLKVFSETDRARVVEMIMSKCPGAQPDTIIPNLYCLPPKSTSFGEHSLVKTGCVVIQDKASTIPSQLLMDEWDGRGDICDACAAPGNKTTHLAAIMAHRLASDHHHHHRQPKIYAFEKDSRRAALLQERINLAGGSSLIDVTHANFLQVTIESSVTDVLLDPSCSGSGVLRSLDRLADVNDEACDGRINALRTFQVQVLQKAMESNSVKHIVYSTCSVHVDENESVVAEVLNHDIGAAWKLKAPARLTEWKRRGLPCSGLTLEQSACLIRCSVDDGMIGFFVAVFEKRNKRPAQEEEKKEEKEGKGEEEEKEVMLKARSRMSMSKVKTLWRPASKFSF